MSKCLRCGAGSEWISGRVADEPIDDRIASLEAEVERLRKDAARYRIIKRNHELPWGEPVPDSVEGRFFVMFGRDPIGCIEGELDTAIDAALQAEGEGERDE